MRGDRAPNRRNRVGAWRKPGGQPPAKRHVAGRPTTDRIVAVTINVDSLRGKVGCVLRAIDDLARRVEARVAVLVLEETKLEPGVEIQIPGFYPASRRDRDRHGGGVAIFVDGAYVAFESYKAAADGGVEAVEVTVLGAENDAACRFLGVYRPPGPGVAALATIDDRAAAAVVNAHDLRRLAPGFVLESRAAAVHLARPAAAAASSRGRFHSGGRRLRLPATRAP